jgi:23S rRNA (guanosine2251-2'-O)-methyltransferase
MPSSHLAILEGALSVQAVLDTRSRTVVRIEIAHGCRRSPVRRVADAARRRGIPVRFVDRAEVDRRASGRTHGGIVALVGPRRFAAPRQLIEGAAAPFLALLDGIEDPYSFGQSIRSLYAAGADGLLVRRPDWSHAEAIVVRASAGASERIPTALVGDTRELEGTVRLARARGLRVVCAHRSGRVAIDEADMSGPVLLAVGGERRGLSHGLADTADLMVTIPYRRRFAPALATAGAAAVLAFEIARQRRNAESSRRPGSPHWRESGGRTGPRGQGRSAPAGSDSSFTYR